MDVVGQVIKKQKVEQTPEDVETAPSGTLKSTGTGGETTSGLPAASQIGDMSSGANGVSSLTIANPNKDLPGGSSKLTFKVCCLSFSGQPRQY